MSSFQCCLPREVLFRIFQYIQPIDLIECLLVCRQWYESAKYQIYYEIRFSKLSTIDRFITCMKKYRLTDASVKKITFTGTYDNDTIRYDSDEESGNGREYGDFGTDMLPRNWLTMTLLSFTSFDGDEVEYDDCCGHLQSRIKCLLELCPHVKTLNASDRTTKQSIVNALLCLDEPLSNLTSFPYIFSRAYNKCALLYKDRLKEFGMCLSKGMKLNDIDLCEVKNYSCLQKLDLTNVPLYSIQEVEIVLSMCPLLENMSVKLYATNKNDSDLLQRQITERLENLQAHSQLQQRYPKMKQFMLQSHSQESIKSFNPFLHKLNSLKRLELDANDILMVSAPHDQFEELKTFFNYIRTIPSITLTIQSEKVNRTKAVALHYLQAIFQPGYKYTSTTLNITWQESFIDDKALRYSTTHDGHLKLKLIHPALETNIPIGHIEYVATFAPYVNLLKICNRHILRHDNRMLQPLLYEVFAQCTELQSLTISCGATLSRALPSTIHTALHTLVLDQCEVTSKFLKSLSTTRTNLRRLTLSPPDGIFGLDHIHMEQTELEQLDIDLVAIYGCSYGYVKIVTNEVKLLALVDYQKEQVTKVENIKKGMIAAGVLRFKKLDRLKFFHSTAYKASCEMKHLI
jgi:hypothetical protein